MINMQFDRDNINELIIFLLLIKKIAALKNL